MNYKKGMAPALVVLIVALGLAAGTTAGYVFREPLQKAIKGESTQDQINNAVNAVKNGQSKFELEGIATSVDTTNSVLTVKITSTTNSVKELGLSETPITVSSSVSIQSGTQKDLELADVPIDSKVHVGGTINDGALTATSILIQKENGLEKQGDNFAFGGAVKEVGSDSLTITVKTANAKVKDQKGKDVVVKVADTTIIEKGDSVIALSDIKVGDDVQATGVIVDESYTATKIEVKTKEQAGTLEQEQENNSGTDSNIQNQNSSNGNSSSNSNSSNSSSNSNKSQ